MCLIVTLVMFALSIQNMIQKHWTVGGIQFLIAMGFLLLLLRNIQKARCDREGNCNNGCMPTDWIRKIFPNKDN